MCTSSLTIYRSLFSRYLRENRNHQGLVTDSRTPVCFPDVAKSGRCLDSSFPSPPVILDDINHQVQPCNRRFLAQNHAWKHCFQPPVGHWERTRSEKPQVLAMGWPGLGLSDPRHTHNVHIRVGGFAREFKLHPKMWSWPPSIMFCPKTQE